ncbi:MAG: hypothetical protein SFU98_16190 [Leptospiraceae bacterium]|nr:hypothetical protein [Leptospiraceae bacterium]
MKIEYYAYQIRYKDTRFPMYVIASLDPRTEKEWEENSSSEHVFFGLFETYQQALLSIQNFEPNFSEWEELDDSYLQGEIVFIRKEN